MRYNTLECIAEAGNYSVGIEMENEVLNLLSPYTSPGA